MTPTPGKQALADLQAAYRDRYAAARQWRAAGRPVVGCVGADVPVELVTAAGALPVRLAADPHRAAGPAKKYVGNGLDGPTLHVLADLLEGNPPLDLLLISRDCESSLQMFYVIRELRRIGLGAALPETHFVDVLHLPHLSTARYNTARLRDLIGHLQRWSGARITDDALADSVQKHDHIRSARRALRALREDPDTTALSGSDALEVIGAGTALPPDAYLPLLHTLVAGATELTPRSGKRVFLTGSSHDNPDIYRALESDGLVVVGEDHDWGDLLSGPLVRTPTLEALAERYQRSGPTAQRAGIAARATATADGVARSSAQLLVSYIRQGDDAPAWDFPAQTAKVTIPAILIDKQPYGSIDLTTIRAAAGATA